MHQYLKLFSFCLPVKGDRRSIICNVQKGGIKFIPNSMYEIVREFEDNSIENVLLNYDESGQKVIRTYIEFVLKENLGFITTEPPVFQN